MTDDADPQHAPLPEHLVVLRYGPYLLILLGIAMLAIGWLDDRDALAGIGLVLVVAGVVLPRALKLEASVSGVKADLTPPGWPIETTRIAKPPPGDDVPRVRTTSTFESGETLVDERPATEEIVQTWAVELVTAAQRREFWVTARGPDLSAAGWAALRGAGPDIEFFSRSGTATATGAFDPADIPEPASWRYRTLVKAATADEAIAAVRTVLDPHDRLFDWKAEPVESPDEVNPQ